VPERGFHLSDSALFISGSLFTTDYLDQAIKAAPAYLAVNVTDLRAKLDAIAAAFPQSLKTNESQTEDDFIWPVLGALGWTESLRQQNLTVTGRDDVPDGLLFASTEAKAAANAIPDQHKRYAHGLAMVESKRWARPLDRASGKDETTAPSTQMLRYLRRCDDITGGKLRWGILTNGTKWRLYWAGARSVSEEFLEIDLGRVLGLGDGDLFADEATRDHWLRVFASLFCRDAFIKDGADNRSFHERARAEAAYYEERVAASLSKLVFEQVFPSLATAIAHAAPDAPLQDVREASLVLLYRLLFLLYAEDRDLLPVGEKRYDDYSLRKQRNEVGKRISENDTFSATATNIWHPISELSRIIDKGDSAVGIPPYNGGLFAGENTPLLDTIRIPDSVMAPALDALSYERSTGEKRYINYRDLSVQQLGSIYERLLEFEIVRDDAGALAVRPNLFARKNSGSYYTPDELVGLILDETLEPLITERLDAFRTALGKLKPKDAEDYQRGELKDADPADAILSLRVCDPAMGSGHFLVSLVDTLADHVLDAMAEAAALGADLHYTSPLATKIDDIRRTILKNAKAANWTIDEAQLDDRHIVRRMVLKRCVYGVDKNPMAVELAKVALWLHTFTVGAPLSFIDHHLHAGDSLFGLWVRDAIDKAAIKGGGGALLYAKPLQEAQSAAAAMGIIERLTDAEIAEAHQSAATWFGIESQTNSLNTFVSFLHALDWLNLNSVEEKAAARALLDGQYGDPIQVILGNAHPVAKKTGFQQSDNAERSKNQKFEASELLEIALEIVKNARSLMREERFLNWQVSFPGVWENWSNLDRQGGFDAVVGNPPWDRFEFEELPWFAARNAAIATEPLKSKRKEMIAALKTSDPALLAEFNAAQERQAAAARIVKNGKIYGELNSGKLNIYKIFVERAMSLIKPDGMVGLLTPIGIGTDHNVSGFLKNVTDSDRLKAFVAFENKRKWLFADVHAEDQPTIFCVGGTARTFAKFAYGVKLHRLPSDPDAPKPVTLTKETLAKVNPTTGTMPIFRSMTDLLIVAKIYESAPVLIEGTGRNEIPTWPIKYRQMVNMTSRSEGFRTAHMLAEQEGAWPIGDGEFESPAGKWLRLYEGKMVSIFNHRYAGVQNRSNSVSGQGLTIHSSDDQLADPDFLPVPRYWILEGDAAPDFPLAIGFNDVCNTNNARSVLSAIVPSGAYGNTLPLLTWTTPDVRDAALLQANLASIPTDYVARQKIQSRHLNKYILAQLPIIPPTAYTRAFGPKTAAEIVREAVLELSYTAHDLAPFARDMGHVDSSGEVLPPFIWDEARRLTLRAKLDALYFILYGVFDPANAAASRDDIRYIYSTFPIVAEKEAEKWGSYKSEELCLAWINALMAGQPDAEIEG
jgi:hypothetical protein